jgi:hypothetical protein
MSVLSSLKRLILPSGRKLRTIPFGLARNIRMQLDLNHQAQRYFGFDERELFDPLRRLMPGCRSMVDVGANDGYYTLIFLSSGAERVIACEPGPLERLVENARANGFSVGDRFQTVNHAIGSSQDRVPLDGIIADLPGPILIKLDVEGGELEVLQTTANSPRLPHTRWIVETHSEELERDCMAWFKEHGFQCTIIPNARWRRFLPEVRFEKHNRWLAAVPASGPSANP